MSLERVPRALGALRFTFPLRDVVKKRKKIPENFIKNLRVFSLRLPCSTRDANARRVSRERRDNIPKLLTRAQGRNKKFPFNEDRRRQRLGASH